jgi:hypothetical protein
MGFKGFKKNECGPNCEEEPVPARRAKVFFGGASINHRAQTMLHTLLLTSVLLLLLLLLLYKSVYSGVIKSGKSMLCVEK